MNFSKLYKVVSSAKPYSTLISACCPKEVNRRYVYDPVLYVCCPLDDKDKNSEQVLIPTSEYLKEGCHN